MHLLCVHRLKESRIQRVSKPGGKANHSQDSQGIVQEGQQGAQGRPNQAILQVLEPRSRPILDGLGVDVVEEGVDGDVPSAGILLRTPKRLQTKSPSVLRWKRGCGMPRHKPLLANSQSPIQCQRGASWRWLGAWTAPGSAQSPQKPTMAPLGSPSAPENASQRPRPSSN